MNSNELYFGDGGSDYQSHNHFIPSENNIQDLFEFPYLMHDNDYFFNDRQFYERNDIFEGDEETEDKQYSQKKADFPQIVPNQNNWAAIELQQKSEKQKKTLLPKEKDCKLAKGRKQAKRQLQGDSQAHSDFIAEQNFTIDGLEQDSQVSQFLKEPRKSKGKGLKTLSLTVYEIVSAKIHTSFKQVADLLIQNLVTKIYMSDPKYSKIPYSTIQKAEHNVKRRAYDALNVLIATGLCSKKGKIVSSVIPCSHEKITFGQSIKTEENQSLQARKQKVSTQIEIKVNMIEQKKRKLENLKKQKEAYANLIARNVYREQKIQAKPKQTIQFPFITAMSESDLKQFRHQVIQKDNTVRESISIKSETPFKMFCGDVEAFSLLDLDLTSKTPEQKAKQYFEKYSIKSEVKNQVKQQGKKYYYEQIPLEDLESYLENQSQNDIKLESLPQNIQKSAIRTIAQLIARGKSLSKDEKQVKNIVKNNKKITDYFKVSKKDSQNQQSKLIELQKPSNCDQKEEYKQDQVTQSRFNQQSETLSFCSMHNSKNFYSNSTNFSVRPSSKQTFPQQELSRNTIKKPLTVITARPVSKKSQTKQYGTDTLSVVGKWTRIPKKPQNPSRRI